VRIAQELIEKARAEGVSLVGEGGLLQQVTRTVLQSALEAEMADHLGYVRGEAPPPGVGNQRNGSSAKTVRTEVGDVALRVPRDRRGSFDPQIVPKHARRIEGFDEAIISLYAKGAHHRGDPGTSGRDLRRERVPGPDLAGERQGDRRACRLAVTTVGSAGGFWSTLRIRWWRVAGAIVPSAAWVSDPTGRGEGGR
jgi:hypothetical protein